MLRYLRPLLSLNGRLDLFEERYAWVEENSDDEGNDELTVELAYWQGCGLGQAREDELEGTTGLFLSSRKAEAGQGKMRMK